MSDETEHNRRIALWSSWGPLALVGLVAVTLILLSTVVEHDGETPWYLSYHVWSAVSREVGFALIISLFIGIFFERESRRKQEQFVMKVTDDVSRDVFASLLGTVLPNKFTNAFLDLARTRVLRTGTKVAYKFSEFTQEEVRGLPQLADRFVKLEILTEYTLRNVSASEYEHQIRMSYPRRSENHFAADTARLVSVTLDDDKLSGERLRDCVDTSGGDAGLFAFTKSIPPGGQVYVAIETVIVKDRSDSEVWTSLVPSEGLKVECDTRGLRKPVVFGLTSSFPMKERPSIGAPATRCWATAESVLPYQSANLWWREPMAEDLNQQWRGTRPA